MSEKEPATTQEKPTKPNYDLPARIKYILLVLLILLLLAEIWSGEFTKLRDGATISWLILSIKLLLIWLLIWLIRVQRRLICKITSPTGCTEEVINHDIGGLSVEVIGSAKGATFSHYTLEWRQVEGQDCQDNSDWSSDGVVYPGGGGTGGSPVTNGTLGWINTTTWNPGSYEIRVCVYSYISGAQHKCCCIQFDLFKKLVWIERVAINPGAPVLTPPGPFDPDAPIVNGNPDGIVVPVGGCVTIEGSAWVGECNNRKIKCFDLRFAAGFLPGPEQPGFNPGAYTTSLLTGPVCYTPPDESGKRAPWNMVIGRELTTKLVKTQIDLFGTPVDVWKLKDYCFDSASKLPECPDVHHHCHSGKYTLLLEVEDTLGNMTYDTQHVWFDNKPIHVHFTGIGGLEKCSDMALSKFLPAGAPCTSSWPADLMGIVYDEYIDEADTTYPSDNFDYYRLYITKQGGPTYQVPITPDLINFSDPSHPKLGRERVGDPGKRCEESISGCSPVVTYPTDPVSDILTKLDLRIFDEVCVGSTASPYTPPPGFALKRNTCCGYSFQIYARDKTWSDGWSGGYHHHWSPPWAVCICNDLPEK